MDSLQERYDNVLLGILQNEGQINGFLDAVIGFLYRRTDFYRIMKSEKDKMGFPPGVAKKIVLSGIYVEVFQKYETLANQDKANHESSAQSVALKSASAKPAAEAIPVAREETVHTTVAANVSSPQTSNAVTAATANATSAISSVAAEGDVTASVSGSTQPVAHPTASADDSSKTVDSRKPDADDSSKTVASRKLDADEDDPNSELSRVQKQYQANPDSYNGAIRENYSWAQSITDVDVRVKIPAHIVKGRDVRVDIARKHLRVGYVEGGGKVKVIVDDDLTWDINKENSLWTIVPGDHVHINLEKIQERWWEAALVSEPKISVRKIDPSRPITDLDDEAQTKIEEMMVNEQRKRMGLPQTHEEKTYELLKKAWDAEGSPFRGTPFDPSRVNITQGNLPQMSAPSPPQP